MFIIIISDIYYRALTLKTCFFLLLLILGNIKCSLCIYSSLSRVHTTEKTQKHNYFTFGLVQCSESLK